MTRVSTMHTPWPLGRCPYAGDSGELVEPSSMPPKLPAQTALSEAGPCASRLVPDNISPHVARGLNQAG
jgi:hypothetical protein